MRRIVSMLLPCLLLAGPWAGAASAAGPGASVPVSVSTMAACITVSGGFSFGTLPFSTSSAASTGLSGATAAITDCAGTAQTILGSVSNLTGTTGSWAPIDPATTSGDAGNPCLVSSGALTDRFFLAIGGGNDATTAPVGSPVLTSVEAELGPLDAGSTDFPLGAGISMPCTGSTGAGESMTGTVTLTATVP